MSEVSVAQAKTHLTRLLQQVEAGEPVQITRRGKPVAVLMSQADFARLSRKGESFTSFLAEWQTAMASAGVEHPGDAEFENLRDQSERPVPDLH